MDAPGMYSGMMATTKKEPVRLVTIDELCHRLSISKRTAYRLIGQKVFPIVKVNVRAVRIPESAVEKFISDRTIQPGADATKPRVRNRSRR